MIVVQWNFGLLRSEQSLFKCLILKKAWKQQENWVNCKVNAVSEPLII
jgi:hypothetical protein